MKNYPAKLLLFGEHVLLLGASALSVPVPAFSGHWEQASPKADIKGLQMRLAEFADSDALKNIPGMDVAQLKRDLLFGLFFRSDIPQGYGLGSSGALCAAVYDRYCRTKTADLTELKTLFARMESFFHGSSSGLDPLTSYFHKGLLVRNKTEVSLAKTTDWKDSQPVVFLMDSQLTRQTGPLVQWFLEQSTDAGFYETLQTVLLPAHEAMLEAWLQADVDRFWSNLRRLSRFQLEHFDPMVPATVKGFWQKNMENDDFALKICGAGGGGFILGFAKDRASAERWSGNFRVIFPFEDGSL